MCFLIKILNYVVFVIFCLFYVSAAPSNKYVGIEGGQAAKIEDFPYQVSIRYHDQHECGGTIISPMHILTSALCLSRTNLAYMTVLAGTEDLTSKDGDIYYVGNATKHEKYNIKDLDYDIGIIKLTNPIRQSQKVALARLEQESQSFNESVRFNVTGWGWRSKINYNVSRYLQQATVSLMDHNSCKIIYEGQTVLSSRQFCSYLNKGPLPFDQGGPASVNGTVIGIISGAAWQFDEYPPIYTNISSYKEWIQQNLNHL